jgi:hypothetical protein
LADIRPVAGGAEFPCGGHRLRKETTMNHFILALVCAALAAAVGCEPKPKEPKAAFVPAATFAAVGHPHGGALCG